MKIYTFVHINIYYVYAMNFMHSPNHEIIIPLFIQHRQIHEMILVKLSNFLNFI